MHKNLKIRTFLRKQKGFNYYEQAQMLYDSCTASVGMLTFNTVFPVQ